MPLPQTGSGIEVLVYSDEGTAGRLAQNISAELSAVGWTDLGVKERPGLIVLRKTKLPAVLLEVGFIDNDRDNQFFDANLAATADAIADGILKTFEELARQTENGEVGSVVLPGTYQVQTGLYRLRNNALWELRRLRSQGFPAFLTEKDGLYAVRAGAFKELDHAVFLERRLRELGYSTLLVRE